MYRDAAPVRRVVDHKELASGAIRLQLECKHFVTARPGADKLPQFVRCSGCRRSQTEAWFEFMTGRSSARPAMR